jgi:hypothetical protein
MTTILVIIATGVKGPKRVARRESARLGSRFGKSGMAARLLEDRSREPR